MSFVLVLHVQFIFSFLRRLVKAMTVFILHHDYFSIYTIKNANNLAPDTSGRYIQELKRSA